MSDETQPITNDADVIDSRDVIERLTYLEYWSEQGAEAAEGPLGDGERAELAALQALAGEGADYAPDWRYGEALIRDSYFTEYAQELAEDIGAVNADASWPAYCIDWERAARDLRMDYSAVDFDGVTYWVRS